jgi:hypothetical protein
MLVWSCSLTNSTLVLEHGSTLHQQIQIFFYSLFGIISDEIWGMIKITALYQLLGYKTLELVVISEPIFSSDNYDPITIPGSSNPVMVEERNHSRAREQRPSRISVQNVDMDVDENDKEEEWHLDVEEDVIHDATNINMDEIDDAVEVIQNTSVSASSHTKFHI